MEGFFHDIWKDWKENGNSGGNHRGGFNGGFNGGGRDGSPMHHTPGVLMEVEEENKPGYGDLNNKIRSQSHSRSSRGPSTPRSYHATPSHLQSTMVKAHFKVSIRIYG